MGIIENSFGLYNILNMSDSPVDLWDKLPGLQDFVTFDGMWGFFNNILTSKVMTLWTDWSL